MPNAQQTMAEFRGDRRSIKMFLPNKLPDCLTLFDLSTTGSSPVVTSASASFSAVDEGKTFWGSGIGPGGDDLLTTIDSVTDEHTIVLTDAPTGTLTGAEFRYGTDWTDAIDAGLSWLATSAIRGGTLFFPRGSYLTRGGHLLASMTGVEGECY